MGFCLPPNRDSNLKVLCENLLTVDQIGETFAAAHRDNTFNVAVGVDSGGNLPAARAGIEIHLEKVVSCVVATVDGCAAGLFPEK